MPKPLVTAVVATYNEERHIAACLNGLLRQTTSPDELEILVIDGGSQDGTIQVVKAFAEFGTRIKLLHNPHRIQACAWNMGMRAAVGKYVTLISAHTEYGGNYIESCIAALASTGAANVGGVQVPVGNGSFGSVVAWAMQSPFAIGNAQFRYARKEQFVNSVFSTFLETAILQRMGGYDESFAVNEDAELNYRLRKAGYRIFCSPKIRVRYHVRSSLPRLAKQMFGYGFWRRRTQLCHPDYMPLRVLAPPLLVVGLVGSAAAFVWTHWWPALGLPAAYGAFLAIGTGSAIARLKKPVALFLTPVVLCAMHLSYGVGWLAGLVTHRKNHVLATLQPRESRSAAADL
jgi:succinoglycan biosynthesis protein ExoA